MTVAAASVASVAAPGGGLPDADGETTLLVWAGALLGGIALVLLRRWPAWGVLTSLACCLGVQLATGEPTGLIVLVLLALLIAATRLELRAAGALLGLSAALYLAADIATGGWDGRVLAPLALMAAATGTGAVVSTQRALLHSATERAAVADQTRRDEAALQVAEERLRIARELHDVVAHHVAVMGIQAGAAEQLLDSDRDQVRAALAQVRASGRTALAELGAVVGLLRARTRDGDPAGEDGDMPPVATGLERLPQLVEAVRAAGLDLTVSGRPDPSGTTRLTEMADLAAYRIVQEALTNAIRHGTGSATLSFAATPAALTVTISNPLAPVDHPTAREGTGHGLVGMRERAALVGAHMSAGPDAGGSFTVQVRIPAHREGWS